MGVSVLFAVLGGEKSVRPNEFGGTNIVWNTYSRRREMSVVIVGIQYGSFRLVWEELNRENRNLSTVIVM